MVRAGLALIFVMVCAAVTAGGAEVARPEAAVGLDLLATARRQRLGISIEMAARALNDAGLDVEPERPLPPDGLLRLVLAAPRDDDCMPRGEPLRCPAIRAYFLRDPLGGARLVRIDAFQRPATSISVAEALRLAGRNLGAARDHDAMTEPVRGGQIIVWQRRWTEASALGVRSEILVTQAPSALNPSLSPDPDALADGIAYRQSDEEAEHDIDAMRRRLAVPNRGCNSATEPC